MMSEQINATCSICGNGYHLCLSCKDSMNLHPWKMHTDSASCYQVFQVVKGYSTGVYNKEEFKSKLKNIDLSNLENYRDHIKSLIKDTLKEDGKEELVVDEVAEVVPVSRKRNYRVKTEIKEAVEAE
jgi:hypothetical protein